jgi:hypothetical protein
VAFGDGRSLRYQQNCRQAPARGASQNCFESLEFVKMADKRFTVRYSRIDDEELEIVSEEVGDYETREDAEFFAQHLKQPGETAEVIEENE